MSTVIFGRGNLGRAIAAGLVARGEPAPVVLGHPAEGGHRPDDLAGAELAFEASRGEAVVANLEVALAAGCRHFVVATTGWSEARDAVDDRLRARSASAVVAPSFSLGVALFLRLIETASELFGRLDGYDPYVLEWHRRDKPDRPSGTALEIARRVLATHPRKTRVAGPAGPPASDELEVASIRAGASPGLHLVGFDAPGESIELRLTARDRSAYVTGALAAADWLRREPRSAGIHPFDEVVDDLVADRQASSAKPRAVAGIAG
ncbi:MAG: dihydrodipicolinate reductase C-terminal domain-containing protein [Chloroflexota bacterium]